MELTARFQSDADQPDSTITFSLHCAELAVDSQRLYFDAPLTDAELAELRWYLEDYPKWPTGPDYARAQQLEAEMENLGRALWESLFHQPEAVRIAQQFLSAGGGPKILTIDSAEPAVLRLPWEMLADEDGHLFNASPPVVVRRRMRRVKQATAVPFSLPLRVLMVISRPAGVGFLDPRSSAVALLDALAPLGEQAVVEFLRPPTVKALMERLIDPSQPPVHVVHFDGHGVYDPAIGLGYLLFEDADQQQDAVNANRLGELLNQANIPLMVLDACQTGDAGELNAFTGVAARLIRSGVGSVLAMSYSVLVETTRRLTAAFYAELTRGCTIGQALDRARLELLADTGRHRLYRPASDREETIQLFDWFLPALYQQQADPAPFAAHFAPAPLTGAAVPAPPADPLPRLPARGGFPPQPRHGFHGRARELLALERAFARRRIVVLHGFGGQGKTSLATQAGAWLTRTGLFQQALFLSVEQGGGLELAVAEFGHALLGQDFNIHEGEPLAAIAHALARTPTLLVLDNCESILPGGDAALPPADLTALLDAAALWAGQGGSRLLLTTRDTSFGHDAYAPGAACLHLPLAGLAGEEALELAGQILEDRGIDRPGRAALLELLGFLGGHPLSLQLVLPHLADPAIQGDVAGLIAEFEGLLPGFVEGQAAQRNQSLALSLGFSLRRLGAQTRAMLPGLGLFQGGAMEFMITGQAGMTVLPEMSAEVWREVRAELSRASLLTAEELPGFTVPFIKFHPTLAPYLAAQLDGESRAELDEGFRQAYHQLASALYQQDNKNPIQSRAMAARELPNLRRALELHRAAGDGDAAVELADRIALFLDLFGRWRERDVMLDRVAGWQGDRVTRGQDDRMTKAEFTLASRQGETLLGQGRAGEAEALFRRLLARMDGGMAYAGLEAGYHRAITLARLGRSLGAQGQAGAAEGVYRQELAALAGLEQTDDVRRLTGAAHTDLADVLAAQGRYAEARTEYEASLEIHRSQGNERDVAVNAGQLGTLALQEGNRDEARRRYRQALESFRGLGEEQHEAIAWHQLGRVAEEGRAWDEAEGCYRESLAIKERTGDKAGAARTCNQLAIVAKNAGRPAQAERWYRRTLEYAELLPDQGARVYNNLANLLLTAYESPDGPRPDLAGAEEYSLKSIAIVETLDLSAEPWKDYALQAQIAEAKGDTAGARAWRRKEQESFAAFPGSWARLQGQFGPLVQAVVAAAQGEPGVKEAVEAAFDPMTNDGYLLEKPIRRMWAGERDVWALTEELDRADALIVRKILAALAGEADMAGAGSSSAPAPSPQASQGEGISLQELLALVLAGCRGDLQQGQRAYDLTGQVLQNPQQPPEVRALGVALQRLLIGMRDRGEILKGLAGAESALAREAVDALLAQLG